MKQTNHARLAISVNGSDPQENGHLSGNNGVSAPLSNVDTAASKRTPWRLTVDLMTTYRHWLLAGAHLVIFALIYWLSWGLRFDFDIPTEDVATLLATLPLVVAVKIVLFDLSGQLHGWWRFVTFADLSALLRISLFSLCGLAAIDHFIPSVYIPRSVLLLDFLLTITILGGSKSSLRVFREQLWPTFRHADYRRALLVGLDESAALLAHQINSHSRLKYRIAGLLLTSGSRSRDRFSDIPVMGTPENVREACERCQAQEVLVTAGILAGARLRRLLDDCAAAGLVAKIIRPIDDLISGNHNIPVRDIEINDLLRRDPVQLDLESIRGLISDATVMVTGAGGSIGSEICRQLVRFQPRVLVMLDRAENSLFFTELELRATVTHCRLVMAIADINDEPRMRQLFDTHRPQVVFHAAAHKHVPMMEANVAEAVKNNVFGTRCLVDLAHEFRVRGFVFISTDKAVNPTSVMGVTKQIAERYVHAMSQKSETAFIVVRFGNVLGSAGSVVPIFQDQIRRGGPITITDSRMTRYFMTIPEATQLVLQAASMGKGYEIFVLDMGEPVKIVNLAKDMIRLSGLPEDSIEIIYTGQRPGEKLFEELYLDSEETLPTVHPKIRAACPRSWSIEEVRRAVASLTALVSKMASDDDLRKELQTIVVEYQRNSSAPPNIVPLNPSIAVKA